MKKVINGITIESIIGNIAEQADCEAVVNAANAELLPGGGVAGAIHHAAGPGLSQECRPLAPIKPGEAVITGGHNLPNKYVIHCLGPVYKRDNPSELLLSSCYRNALKLAEDYQLSTIAFCAISTGVFGYPMPEAATVAFRTIREQVTALKTLKLIRFVLFRPEYLEIHQKILLEIRGIS